METLETHRYRLSDALTQELSTFHPQDILHIFFPMGAAQEADAQKARITALERQAALYASRIAALASGPETPPPPAAELVLSAGRSALSYLDAIEMNVREMEWNGTGRYGRQSFGRMKQQRLAKENAEALLPVLNLFYAGFTQIMGEESDMLSLLDWYFEGLFVGVWVLDGTDEAKKAVVFGRERLTDDMEKLASR